MVVHHGRPSMNHGSVVVHDVKVVLFKIKQKTSNDTNIHYGYCLYYILDTISCISSDGGIWRVTYQTTMLLFWKNVIIVSIFSKPILIIYLFYGKLVEWNIKIKWARIIWLIMKLRRLPHPAKHVIFPRTCLKFHST